MTSIVTKTIKPGGGGDYTSLSAAISGEAASVRRDLTGQDIILRLELWANGTTGLAMTTGQAINYSASAASGSFRTDRTRYIWIDVNPGDRHVGVFDASKAKIKKAGGSAWGNGYVIFGSVDIKITGLQLEWGYNTGDNVTLFYPNGGAPGHNQYYEVDGNLFHGTGTYTAGVITFMEDGYSDPEVLKCTNNIGNGVTGGFYQSLQLQPLIGERVVVGNTFRLVGDEVIGAVGLLASPNPTSRVVIAANIGAFVGTHTNVLFPGMPGTVPANWHIAGNYSQKAEGVGASALVVESATFTFTDATNGDLSLASGDASGAKTGGYTGHEQQFISLPFRNDATSPTLRRPVPWSAGAVQFGGEGSSTLPEVSAVGLTAQVLSGDINVPYPPFIAEDYAIETSLVIYLHLSALDAVTSGLAAAGWTACSSNNTNTNSSPNLRTEVWAKASDGTETGNLAITRTSGGICEAHMYTSRHANTTTLFDASSVVSATSSTTLSFSTLTTVTANARVMALSSVASHSPAINAAPSGASLTWAKLAIHTQWDPRARVIYKYGSNAWANPNAASRTAIGQKVQIPIPSQARVGDTLLVTITVHSLTITLNSTDLTASGLTQGGSDQVERTDTTATITARYYEKVLTSGDVIPGYIQIALTSNAWWTATTTILRNVGARASLVQGMNGTTNGGTSQTAWTWPTLTISASNGIATFWGSSDVRFTRPNTKTAGQTWGGTFTMAPDDGFTSGDGTYEYSQAAGCPNATSTNFNSTSFAYNTYPTNAVSLGATITMNAAGRGATFAVFHPPTVSATVGVGQQTATGGIKAAAGSVASVTATLSSAAVKTGILYAIAPAVTSSPVSATQATNYEVNQGIAATSAQSYEVLQGLAVAAPTLYEVLMGLRQTQSAQYEALAGVSATQAANYEVLQGLAAAIATAYEMVQSLAPTAAVAYEALSGIATALATNYESVQALAISNATAYEFVLAVSATAAAAYEYLQGIAAASTTQYEAQSAALGVSNAIAVAYEVLQGLAPAQAVGFETLSVLTTVAQIAFEQLLSVLATASAQYEALGFIAQASATAYETVQALATASQTAYEALQAIATAQPVQYENQGLTASPVSQTAVVAFEVLQAIVQTAATAFEYGGPISAIAPVQFETTQTLSVAQALAFESLAGLATAIATALEATQEIRTAVVTAFESQQLLITTQSVQYEYFSTLISSQATFFETLVGLNVSQQVAYEQLQRITMFVPVQFEAQGRGSGAPSVLLAEVRLVPVIQGRARLTPVIVGMVRIVPKTD